MTPRASFAPPSSASAGAASSPAPDSAADSLPPECMCARIVPMTTEDGRLGVAVVVNNKLYLWSRESCPDDGDAGWVQSRVIELEELLPKEALSTSHGGVDVDGAADGLAVIFLRTDKGVFTIDLKSCQVKKVYKDSWISGNFPFLSFYTPAVPATFTVEGPRTGTSNA